MPLFGKQLEAWPAHQVNGKKTPQSETKQRIAPRKKRKGPPRKGPSRDEGYKGWIRTLPCCACGIEGRSEAAHTGDEGGMSMKASDYSCVPLCAACHTQAPHAYHPDRQGGI